MKQIPILLITGFLGSGKTTFINWLLKSSPTVHISVVLNEFGDVALESQFIEEKNAFVAELSNGCMCCVAKSDIPHIIHLILDKAPQTEYILIEASGLSDPDPIRQVLTTSEVSTRVYLHVTICLIDILNFEESQKEYAIVSAQLSDANVLLVSKIDKTNNNKISQTQKILCNMLPGVPLYLFDLQLSPKLFLQKSTDSMSHNNSARIKGERSDTSIPAHTHEHINKYIYKTQYPLSFSKYESFIAHLPTGIIRVKGVAYMIDEKGTKQKLLSQYVNGVHEFHIENWGKETPSTVILFIGKRINPIQIKERLDACIDLNNR